MTAAELTAQIRAAKPIASDDLRNRVQAIAIAKPAPPFRARLRLPRLRIVLPVAAATAVAAAAAIALVRPATQHQNTLAAERPTATEQATRNLRTATAPSAADSSPSLKAAGTAAPTPVPTPGRATHYAAELTISVKNADALSSATTRAQSIVRDLGGYVVSVSFASADAGNAALTLRVPTARVQEALTQLAALGRVVSQQAQIEDLQATLDRLDRRVTILRARIAHISALLTDTSLSSVRRAELEAQRSELQTALRATHQNRSTTANDARYATIQLQLQTAAKALAPPPSDASRILGQAGRILAWQAAAVLYALVILGPFAIVAAALALAARARRRGQETRLLARS